MYAIYRVDTWWNKIELVDTWVTEQHAKGCTKDLNAGCGDTDKSYHYIQINLYESAPKSLPFASTIKSGYNRKGTNMINPNTIVYK